MQLRPKARLALLALVLAVTTIVARSVFFYNPIIHLDEEFYLLAGERMLHGDLPYVGVWDRKPFGLFLLFAGMRLLGGHGLIQYQVVAALFAAATTGGIGVWAARSGRTIVGGAIAGLLYIAIMHRFTGSGGEAEVFMNALMLAAAAFNARALREDRSARAMFRDGLLAMLFIGLAIQIKTTAVFPGALFGCTLLYRAYRRDFGIGRVIASGVAWAGMAVVPTLLSLIYYVSINHLDAYVFANFTSITLRGVDPESAERLRSLATNLVAIAGIAALLTVIGWRKLEPASRREVLFLAGWLAICLVSVLAIGGYFDNYVLIIGPAASILIGRWSRPAGLGFIGIGFVIAFAAYVGKREVGHVRGARPAVAAYERVVARIAAERDGSCLFVYRGYPAYYRDGGTCMPSRYLFPALLHGKSEEFAVGVNVNAEVRRILDTKPKLIITAPTDANGNPVTDAMVSNQLAADYLPIASDGLHTLYRRK